MRIRRWTPAIAMLLLMASCGGEQPKQDTLNVDAKADSTQAERIRKTRNIFHNIPSPMETAGLLKKAGAEYDKHILNDVKNVDNYTSASRQALNLGIYGADLSYASVFNNTQESMLYTACAQNLAKRLDVSNAFDQRTVDRMEENRNDRDSLLNIISETYWNVDAYLKEAGRDNISALMIAGGWLEGLYIATQVTRTNDTPELRQRIAEQKLSLGQLIELMNTYSTDDPAVSGVYNDLKALNELYAGVGNAPAASTVTQDKGVTVIGGGPAAAALTNEQLKALTEKATTVRNSYIN
jgi:hypothetical protein